MKHLIIAVLMFAATARAAEETPLTALTVTTGANSGVGDFVAGYRQAAVVEGQQKVIATVAGVFQGPETDTFHTRGWPPPSPSATHGAIMPSPGCKTIFRHPYLYLEQSPREGIKLNPIDSLAETRRRGEWYKSKISLRLCASARDSFGSWIFLRLQDV